MAWLRTFTQGITLVALAVGSLGCSQQSGSISGEVTLNGKPVPGGVISFHSEDGNPAVIDAPITDGRYAVSGVPSGNAVVTVGVGPAAKRGPVPAKYADPDTSGLTLIVQPGEQSFPVSLAP